MKLESKVVSAVDAFRIYNGLILGQTHIHMSLPNMLSRYRLNHKAAMSHQTIHWVSL